jgi:hypothetical protein
MEPTDLLEVALPPLPPDLQIAPLRQLRGRIRRRRRVRVALLAAVVLTVGAGIAVPLAGRKGESVAWQYARIDRTGTILTIFTALGACLEAASRADARAVVITVRLARRTCAPIPLTVHLTASLGTRALIDGADGRIRTGFPDRDLPWPPAAAGYAEHPLAGGTTADPVSIVEWTRPGGPDLQVTARTGRSAGAPAGLPLGPAPLARRTGAYYRVGATLELRWDVGALVYELAVSRISLPQFQALVAAWSWPR